MRKITAIFFSLLLFPAIFQESPITGGAEKAFAAEAYPERGVFAVTIENNTSKVSTVMTVFAKNEQDAHDQVALNGWTVIEVKRLTEKDVKRFDLSADSINSVTPGRVRVESSLKEGAGQALGGGKDGTEDTAGYPPMRGASGRQGTDVADNLDILPTSPELEFIGAYYFELGNTEPAVHPLSEARLAALDKNRSYVIFGHADEVPVGGNAPYGSNYELSFKRAQFVKDIMVKAGIPAAGIRAVGLGTGYPVEESSQGGNMANRRAEIYVFRDGARGR